MESRQFMGMVVAGTAYLVLAVIATVIVGYATRKLPKEKRLPLMVVAILVEVLGMGLWLYMIWDLQKAFGAGVG